MRQICKETLQPRENAQEIKSFGGPPSRQVPRLSQVAALAEEDEVETTNEAEEAQPLVAAMDQQPKNANRQRGPPKKGLGKGSQNVAAPPPSSSSQNAPISQNSFPPNSKSSNVAPTAHQITIHVKCDSSKPSGVGSQPPPPQNMGGGSWNGGRHWNNPIPSYNRDNEAPQHGKGGEPQRFGKGNSPVYHGKGGKGTAKGGKGAEKGGKGNLNPRPYDGKGSDKGFGPPRNNGNGYGGPV